MKWDDTHGELATTSEHVGSEDAFALSGGDDRLKGTDGVAVLRAHTDHCFTRANTQRCDRETLNDAECILLKEESVGEDGWV